VLHIEFQVKDEPEMVYRMAEYFIMLHRLYKIEVRQYVIYLGQGLSTMPTEFVQGKMNFRYELISLSCIDHRLLLSARDPKAKILAILGDFGSKPPQQVVNDIAKQVFESSEGDFAEKRHIKQLRVLMKLRNLDLENLHEMDSLAPYLTPERDFLYKIGERKGMEAGLEKGETKKATSLVKNLLRKTDFTVAQIAELVDVSQYFVRKVKRSITSRTR
jgi:predicted transposase/invertase (TIGR01784 family)